MDEEQQSNPILPVKTYTEFWALEKKLYSIYDLSLPAPVSLKAVGIALGIGIPWCILLAFLHVPVSPPWFMIYLAPPILLAIMGSRPIFEGKNIFQYLGSIFRYTFESRRYKGVDPTINEDKIQYEYEGIAWRKDNSPAIQRKSS